MAKRTSLSERRERDVRGTDLIFGGAPADSAPAEVAEPEVAASAEPEPVAKPAAARPRVAAVASMLKAPATPEAKAALSKVTLYIRPDQVIAIETIQLNERQKTGAKPDKSDLVQEALDLLTKKYGLK
ncbi:hypothetical protein EON80_18810 [bacterium]|nr:MAG: hypothetical protein EON80_18810 [bacterium]